MKWIKTKYVLRVLYFSYDIFNMNINVNDWIWQKDISKGLCVTIRKWYQAKSTITYLKWHDISESSTLWVREIEHLHISAFGCRSRCFYSYLTLLNFNAKEIHCIYFYLNCFNNLFFKAVFVNSILNWFIKINFWSTFQFFDVI